MKSKSTLTIILTIVLNYCLISQNWTQQTSGTTEQLNGCFFINANNGWVVGNNGIILTTINGGLNWTPQTSGVSYDLNAVYFVDPLVGYCGGKCGTMLKTINGGSTWNIQMQNPSTACSAEFRTIVMSNSVTGVGAGTQGATYSTNSFSNSTTPWSGNFFHIQKVPYTNTIFTCTNTDIKKSTDFGQTWSIAQNYTSNLGTLSFGSYIDPNNIFVCNKLAIFKYEYTGTAYAWVNKYTSTTFYINSLEFRTQQNGYFATSMGSIYNTSTSGLTWNQQTTSISTPLNRLFFFDDNTAWCVGNNGVILKLNGTTTGLTNSLYNNNYNLYPNPIDAGGAIKISNINEIEYINVLDLKGSVVKTINKSELKSEIIFNTPGLFIVETKTSNGVFRNKIIVK